MEELYRIETWQTRTSVMEGLKELGWFPKAWIVTHFTDLSPDEIEELEEMESDANSVSDQGGGGGGGGGGLGGLDDLGQPPDEQDDMDILSDLGGLSNQKPDQNNQIDQTDDTSLEGFDYKRANKIIVESLKLELYQKRRAILEKWARRRGTTLESYEKSYCSGFDNYISNKELDGLVRGKPTSTIAESADDVFGYDPNDDPNLLVEWSVPKEIREEAMREVYDILIDEASTNYNDTDEITINDLPVNDEIA